MLLEITRFSLFGKTIIAPEVWGQGVRMWSRRTLCCILWLHNAEKTTAQIKESEMETLLFNTWKYKNVKRRGMNNVFQRPQVKKKQHSLATQCNAWKLCVHSIVYSKLVLCPSKHVRCSRPSLLRRTTFLLRIIHTCKLLQSLCIADSCFAGEFPLVPRTKWFQGMDGDNTMTITSSLCWSSL